MEPWWESFWTWVDIVAGRVFSWPFVVLFFLIAFYKPIKGLIPKITKIKPPGGPELELQEPPLSTEVILEKLPPEEEVPPEQPSTPESEEQTPQKQKEEVMSEVAKNLAGQVNFYQGKFREMNQAAFFWHFNYLNLFLAPNSKKALRFINENPGTDYMHLRAALGLDDDLAQRELPNIIAALRVNDLVTNAPGAFYISPRGEAYLKYLGDIVYKPIAGLDERLFPQPFPAKPKEN